MKKNISIKSTPSFYPNRKNKPFVLMTPPHKNACWNVALSLASGKDYQEIRKKFKKNIHLDGGLAGLKSFHFLKSLDYKPERRGNLKTINKIAEESKKNEYEYVAVTVGHMCYISNGIIYDTHPSHFRRTLLYFKRKKLHPGV